MIRHKIHVHMIGSIRTEFVGSSLHQKVETMFLNELRLSAMVSVGHGVRSGVAMAMAQNPIYCCCCCRENN